MPFLQLTLFDAFAIDENPHVRQAACLALPALTRHLHPYKFKKEHTLKVLPGFFQDETKEIQNTALEVLGELIYAFHEEDEGLPRELIDYFLGPPRPKKEPRGNDGTLNIFSTAKGLSLLSGLDDEDDYRQIVCAFNVSDAQGRTRISITARLTAVPPLAVPRRHANRRTRGLATPAGLLPRARR
jgi:serine/threonine-protein phosphatase 4 regulatory subunit 1